MENNPRSIREQFDRMFTGQNPSHHDLFAPSSSTVNAGSLVQDHFYGHQQPPLNVNANGYSPFFNKDQRRLPANPVWSILDYPTRFPEFDPYSSPCNSYNIHPGVSGFNHQSSLNGFLETLNDRNLEFNFNRLNLSSPTHNPQPFLPSPVPVNRNTRCQDMCCNPHSIRRDNCGGFVTPRTFNNVLDIPNPPNPSNSLLQPRAQPKRAKFPASLKDIRGKICMVAKDQEGCQFLQTKCEGGKPEDIEMIFNEIKDHIFELMTDASMNYLAQKLFKVCNERQMTHIVVSVISDDSNLTNICLNSHGTRAMQKLIELLKTAEDRSLMVSALRRITLTLTKNTNGHHVIQHCLKSFHVDEVQPILDVVADNCLDIATDKSGCCVLQLCVLHAEEVSKERLMTEIIENALDLSEHPYGNYVVQHILGMQIPEITAHIMRKLAGNFVNLAMNKYASNVVEKCLKDAPDDQSTPIISEIINSPNFLGLIQHPFGNYVAQSVLQIAKGTLKEMMINKVQKEYAYLHSHPHGKRVLALARNSKPRGSLNLHE
ncbi:putative pumilio homolog 8, chloroplastic [Bidens hawaiensis]|uniref:putative pumilio homolog 8, chloroplastic n=1 Tax=Bidens hawaiensis TaxID=980011 RepID=UPI004049421F